MSNILVSKPDTRVNGKITLPGSKSESNRALIMQALCTNPVVIGNLSEAADTVTLKTILDNRRHDQTLDVGPAGTAMRFLTAFCAVTPGNWTLTGSQRMKERPIGLLADALRLLGADIEYTENDGFPPMRIRGKQLDLAGEVHIPGNISSQYISALLMIAPMLPRGLKIHLIGTIGSRPYIEMTLAMMGELGIRHQWNDNTIEVPQQACQPGTLTIEPDWSGASYWYSMAALADEADLTLPWLKQQSLQGDRAIAGIMKTFGVETTFSEGGIRLIRTPQTSTAAGQVPELDFVDCPDLAQTVISCCVALGRSAIFTGLASLRIKETDRIAALRNELGTFGARVTENEEGHRWGQNS